MACFESLLARRLLLWYILIASIIVLAMSWDVVVGCRFVLAGAVSDPRRDLVGFGLFRQAVYDDEDGSFLGCVRHSNETSGKIDDTFFRVGKAFAALLAIFVTLATPLCLFVQCCSKHGKSFLWSTMTWSYFIAFISQGLVFLVLKAELCEVNDENQGQCRIGANGISAAINLVFLLGMVIATCSSLAPKNPVFGLWNHHAANYDTDKMDTDDDDTHDVEKAKNPSRAVDDESVSGRSSLDSVSLFGSSYLSHSTRRSKRSDRSSVGTSSVSKTSTDADGSSSRDRRSRKSNSQRSSLSELSAVKEEEQEKDEISRHSGSKGSESRTLNSNSMNSDSLRNKSKPRRTPLEPTASPANSVAEESSGILSQAQLSSSAASDRGDQASAQSSEISFITRLGRSVTLEQGGVRVSEKRVDTNKLEIVDRYPATLSNGKKRQSMGEESPEIVRIRTEYCPVGRKTIKEVTHCDGSRTTTTLIDPVTIGGDRDSFRSGSTRSSRQST